MKAYTFKTYGKKETLQLTDQPVPTVNDHDVLIQVHAAGVNALDAMIRNGEFKLVLPYKPPFLSGHDVAGIITQTGSKVSRFKVGDEVYSRPTVYRPGTFAEYISIHENEVALKPKNLSMEEAGSIPLVGLTAWQALVETGKVQKGQKVFIQAGSGGVGTFAIQLAKHLGAYVATTTSAKNAELVKSLGADLIINYQTEDFESKLKDYDLVLHSNKESAILAKSLRVLKPGGQLISLSGPPTPEFADQLGKPWPLKLVMNMLSLGARKKAKRKNVAYKFLFMRAEGAQLAQITKLIEADIIKPVLDKVFPFEQTNEALSYVETGRAKGKVVVKVI